MKLLDKIETREAVIAVVGLGYVGLPLAVCFAEAGFQVYGIDISSERVRSINQGISHIPDILSERLKSVTVKSPAASLSEIDAQEQVALPTGRLTGTTNYEVLHKVDAVIICVPTPLTKAKDPDMSFVLAVTNEIAERIHRDMLVILESTSYPGTTEELILPRLQKAAQIKAQELQQNGRPIQVEYNGTLQPAVARDAVVGSAASMNYPVQSRSVFTTNKVKLEQVSFAVGQYFHLCFSPERIDPGRTDFTLKNTPKVVGGVTPACTRAAIALYNAVVENVIPVSSPREAEMTKLLENTFRAVNIGLINEIAIMCHRLDINVWEVIDAAKTKPFGFMPFYPGPGLGGHCIPIDPHYLAWRLKMVNYNARFIQLASEVNEQMPHFVLSKIADALNDHCKPLRGAHILLLGVAYKPNIDDLRESPALQIIELLQGKGCCVYYNDPYVSQLKIKGEQMKSIELTKQTLQQVDCVVITSAHSLYDWKWIVKHSQLVIDTPNATKAVRPKAAHVMRL